MVQRHEYSVEDKNSITVKYREEDSTTGKEIVMKFDSAEHLAYWEQVSNPHHTIVFGIGVTDLNILCSFPIFRL